MVISNQIKKQIIEKYKNDVDVADIAKEFNVPISTCYYLIKKHKQLTNSNNESNSIIDNTKDNSLIYKNYIKLTNNNRALPFTDDYLYEMRTDLIWNVLFERTEFYDLDVELEKLKMIDKFNM